jgi:hypothetical protein
MNSTRLWRTTTGGGVGLLFTPGFDVVSLVCVGCCVHLPNRKAFELINSPENHEKMGGLMAIDELIDVQIKENDTKIIRFANFLRGVFPSTTADADALRLAAKTLGAVAVCVRARHEHWTFGLLCAQVTWLVRVAP